MKRFTKGISLLMILSMFLTVGGVYAAWSYAASAGVSDQITKSVSLTTATQKGTLGKYEILYQDFDLIIDQTADGDYTPLLKFQPVESKAGDLTFKFTPEIIASNEIKEICLNSTVTFSSTLTHGGNAIFSFPKTINIGKVGSDAEFEWVKVDDGAGAYFTCTISNAKLSEYIQLAYTEDLDTYAKYQAFQASLQTGTVVVNIANETAS